MGNAISGALLGEAYWSGGLGRDSQKLSFLNAHISVCFPRHINPTKVNHWEKSFHLLPFRDFYFLFCKY